MQDYDIKKLFGIRLKNLRKKRGLTQAQIAELVNVDAKHISCIENAKTFPSSALISDLVKAFNIHPKELFEFEETPSMSDLKNEIIKALDDASPEEVEKIYVFTKFTLS